MQQQAKKQMTPQKNATQAENTHLFLENLYNYKSTSADVVTSPHLLLSQLSGPLVEVDVSLPQDDMGVTSANTLRQHRVTVTHMY